MNIDARVVHELPGRTRIKVISQRGNGEYFHWVSQQLDECPGVRYVRANVTTGSLLIEHSVSLDQLAAFAEQRSLFALERRSVTTNHTVLNQAAANFTRIDAHIIQLSGGKLDIRSLLLLALIGLSMAQIARGQILVPAVTLLWYAMELLYTESPNTQQD